MKEKIILCFAWLALNSAALSGAVQARATHSWTGAELEKTSDLVVVATPIVVNLIYANRKLGKISEAEKYEKDVIGARKRDPHFPKWSIYDDSPDSDVPSW